MDTPTLSVLRSSAELCNNKEFSLDDQRAEFVEAPDSRKRGARGALTGILLGAGLWGVILVLAGVIKL